ncbi:hypothetical protein [Lachnoclostridium phytofermentans]|uniref:Uncharacterized protein n=1 Tax=Lachnoclostridium phytofermentans (strain ATCC 700394 / DSM 18823 / ISDg) TaxID=357809 RepID=A9KRP8_LACP7|nr:hypothetical protein [Lachnoclostridium phytofermentans]ABX43542.1 hypothetical protein Cphy_3188 [Lachnoclostridium phytofermentans ISDg]
MKGMIIIQKVRLISWGILIILILVILSKVDIGVNSDFNNSFFVITKNEVTNVSNYYELNDKGKRRKAEKFEPDKMEEFTINNCYKSYISGNKVLNKLTLDTCVIKDDTGNSIEIAEEFRKIIEKVSDLKHSIIKNKILKINNEYYVVVELNVKKLITNAEVVVVNLTHYTREHWYYYEAFRGNDSV